jgi:hypothetical protein
MPRLDSLFLQKKVLAMQLLRNRVKFSTNTQVTGSDRHWLQSQGYDWPPPRHIRWYYPNGTSGMGPSDPYHLALYRSKGFTLRPPPYQDLISANPLALLVSQRLNGQKEWSGEPSELKRFLMTDTEVSALSRLITSREVSTALAELGIAVKRFRTRTARGVHIARTA